MGVVRCGPETAALQYFVNALRRVIGMDPLYGEPKQPLHEINSIETPWRQPRELRVADATIALSSGGWFQRQKARDPERGVRAALARHPDRGEQVSIEDIACPGSMD